MRKQRTGWLLLAPTLLILFITGFFLFYTYSGWVFMNGILFLLQVRCTLRV